MRITAAVVEVPEWNARLGWTGGDARRYIEICRGWGGRAGTRVATSRFAGAEPDGRGRPSLHRNLPGLRWTGGDACRYIEICRGWGGRAGTRIATSKFAGAGRAGTPVATSKFAGAELNGRGRLSLHRNLPGAGVDGRGHPSLHRNLPGLSWTGGDARGYIEICRD